MLRDIRSHQRGVRLIEVQIDVSEVAGKTDTKDGILRGTEHLLATDNGGNEIRLSLVEPGSRPCMVLGLFHVGGSGYSSYFVDSGVDFVEINHDSGDFMACIAVFDSEDET